VESNCTGNKTPHSAIEVAKKVVVAGKSAEIAAETPVGRLD
jgi:hypothetical protein